MEEHPDFDKELRKSPTKIGADRFVMVLPWDRNQFRYTTDHINYAWAEDVITAKDIKLLLQMLEDVPNPVNKGRNALGDALAILFILISFLWLAISIYFCLGEKFRGGRAINLIICCCFSTLLLVACIAGWIYRARKNKIRVGALNAALKKAQDDIFSPKGAILSMSPLESYIMIEMVWKYCRIAIYGNDKDCDETLSSLASVCGPKFNDQVDKSEDRELMSSVYRLATKIPEPRYSQLAAIDMFEQELIGDVKNDPQRDPFATLLNKYGFHVVDTEKYCSDSYRSLRTNSILRHLNKFDKWQDDQIHKQGLIYDNESQGDDRDKANLVKHSPPISQELQPLRSVVQLTPIHFDDC